MKKRTALMFSAGLFLIVLAVLFSLLINGSLRSEGGIVLPQSSTQIEEAVDIAKRNRRKINEVTVTADNVQAVIATLSRPQAYGYTAEKTYYYPSGSALSLSLVRVSGDRGRVDVFDTTGTVYKQLVCTLTNVYIWGRGELSYYTADRNAFSLEDEAGVPTYESILAISADDIIDAGVREHNGRLCVYLTSSYELGRYTREWYVDIDSGLMYSCDTREGGELVCSVVCRDMTIGEQDGGLFVLPNGQTAH